MSQFWIHFFNQRNHTKAIYFLILALNVTLIGEDSAAEPV